MGHDLETRIGAIAARQHGVFTRAQALSIGFTEEQIDYRLEIGRWTALAPGIYAVAGAVVTWKSHLLGAVLRSGAGAAASHRSAAHLWGVLPRFDGRIEIVTPLSGQHGEDTQRIVRRAQQLGRRDVRQVDGIPATVPARTLVDLARVVQPEQLEVALDEFLGLGLVSVRAVQTYIADRHLQHRPGAVVLRELLRDRSEGVPQKELERRFLRLIRDYGLPRPVKQRPSGPHKIDFAYPELMIAIEVDGWNSHRTPRDLDYDTERQNRLVLEGWTPLRFTWKRVTHEPDAVAAEIRLAIESRRRLIRS